MIRSDCCGNLARYYPRHTSNERPRPHHCFQDPARRFRDEEAVVFCRFPSQFLVWYIGQVPGSENTSSLRLSCGMYPLCPLTPFILGHNSHRNVQNFAAAVRDQAPALWLVSSRTWRCVSIRNSNAILRPVSLQYMHPMRLARRLEPFDHSDWIYEILCSPPHKISSVAVGVM